MRLHHAALLFALTFLGSDLARQTGPAAAPLTDEQIETFLRTARVTRTRGAGKGVTGSTRATLSDGTLTHDAQIQTIDERKTEFRASSGAVEFNFRDSWRFNVAVYKIDRILGLQLVPVSVARTWNSNRGAFTWWVDDVMMDEGERLKRKMVPPDNRCWSEQIRLVRILDQLIDNIDRNIGNLLITKRWRIWAIDHTRAFRYSPTPRNTAMLTGVDRDVLARLETLDFPTLKQAVGEYITDADIRTLLSRRDGIVAHLKGFGDVALYNRKDPAQGCSP